MKNPTASEFEDAWVLLHGQGIDLVFGTSMWTIFNETNRKLMAPLLDGLEVPAARLYFSHILLTLSKVTETYKKYKYLLPEDSKSSLKEITTEIEKREIIKFRNKVIGHIWDKETGRPLKSETIDLKITAIVQDREEFFSWILNTVVGELKKASATLKREHEQRKNA